MCWLFPSEILIAVVARLFPSFASLQDSGHSASCSVPSSIRSITSNFLEAFPEEAA
jgi:hypothetical protein